MTSPCSKDRPKIEVVDLKDLPKLIGARIKFIKYEGEKYIYIEDKNDICKKRKS